MLALMAEHGVPLLRTDCSGDVTLTAGPSGLVVAAAHPGRALAAARSPCRGGCEAAAVR